MMNIKKGNTRSVGVKPCHAACPNGAYTNDHDPGLLTMIMPAIVIPRRISSASRRRDEVSGRRLITRSLPSFYVVPNGRRLLSRRTRHLRTEVFVLPAGDPGRMASLSRQFGMAVLMIRDRRLDISRRRSRCAESAVSPRQVRRLAGSSWGSCYIDGVKPEMKNGLLNSYYG